MITDAGGHAVFVETDVSDEAQVANLVDAAVESYGSINVLVNDAAAFVFGKVEDVTTDAVGAGHQRERAGTGVHRQALAAPP